ncbi:MAG: glycosyltransferase family 4 protein [Rubrivivax sp.]|nr:glycosyltransferase family 4 protein [Rubrivivax sp.]
MNAGPADDEPSCSAQAPVHPDKRLRILLSAYACEPDRGSEPGVGWHWMRALLQQGHELVVLTRANNQERIEQACARQGLPLGERLHFLYHDLAPWVLRLKKRGLIGTQMYYAAWQRGTLAIARQAHQRHAFDLCHHLTFGVWRQPSPLHRLGVPFMFGPVGGGEEPPWSLVPSLGRRDRLHEHARHWLNRVATWSPDVQQCLRDSARVLAKTPQTAAWIARAGGQADNLLEIGIDSAVAVQRPRAPGPQGASLRCLYAGRLIGLKGVHLAIQACEQAVRAGTDVHFTIVGKGPEKPRLERLAASSALAGRIRWVDWLDRESLFREYAAHDVLLFPSLHDSSGNVVLESFSLGLPVVCLDLGGPGVMVDGSNGMAIPAPEGTREEDAARGLAQALQRLAADPLLLERLAEGALATARSMSWQAMVAQAYAPLIAALPTPLSAHRA